MSGTAHKLSIFNDQANQKTRDFVLKHVYKNVSKMEKNQNYYGDTETHYGVPWTIGIKHTDNHLGIYLFCEISENKKESVETEFETHVFHPSESSTHLSTSRCFTNTEGYGRPKFINWGELEKEYLVNDELKVEIRVKIFKMTGVKIYLRRFDDDVHFQCSDVALVVNEKKFYVSKLYLASQTSYFKFKFFGCFDDFEQSELELTGVDEYDLQKYLEMLYAEDALDDETVKGILHLADMYDTKTLCGKCEEHLLTQSTKTLKEKLEMSVKYNLTKLKNKCMSEIKTIDDIHSVLPVRIRDLDHDILADILQKTLALK